MRPRRRRLQRLRKKWTLVLEGIVDPQYIVRRTQVTYRVWGQPRGCFDNISKIRSFDR